MNKKILSLFVLLVVVLGATKAFASLTFSSAAITGDTDSIIDVGSKNALLLQTTNNGNIITGSGKVGIGTVTPVVALDVNGNINMKNTSARTISVGASGELAPPDGFSLTIEAGSGDTSGGNFYLVGGSGVLKGNVILAHNGVSSLGNVGVGVTAPAQKLEVNGGVRLNTVTAKPTCDATVRGTFWSVQGGAGVKDTVEVCAKDATDAYAWRTIY